MILNDKQRKLVEDNHKLIYFYAKKYNIDLEDYYDILAMALCYAAYNYDESKGAFSTLAIKTMYLKTQHVFNYNVRQKRVPKDKLIHYENMWQMQDLIKTSHSPENIVINKIDNYDKINNVLNLINNERNKNILIYRMHGLTVSEIGKKVNLTHQSVSKILRDIRKKVIDANIF